MRIQRSNLAIANHAGLSRDLLLFETTNKGGPVRYIGQFVCAGWFAEQQPDTNGDLRQAIVFKLVPLASFEAAINDNVPEGAPDAATFNELRMRAYAAASMTENPHAVYTTPADLSREQWPEPVPPKAHRLTANVDAAFR